MGGWTIELGFTLRGKRTFVEKESRLEEERKRGLSSEGVILSIVLRAFLPVTRSPERSRLYHSVYPLFSGTFTVRYRNTTVRRCQSFPLRGSFAVSPSRHRDVPARHPLRSSPKSLLRSRLSSSSSFSHLSHGVTLLSDITRKAYLYFTDVERVLYTCLRRDILAFSRDDET
jgi:hypothetical protein